MFMDNYLATFLNVCGNRSGGNFSSYFPLKEQASWVCQCDDRMVQRLEQDFKSTLQEQNSLEQWAAWLEGVVTEVLEPHENSPNFAKAARQFLLKWSFYR